MSSTVEMLLPKGESNGKTTACGSFGIEDKRMLAGVNILQNQWEVPKMNFT